MYILNHSWNILLFSKKYEIQMLTKCEGSQQHQQGGAYVLNDLLNIFWLLWVITSTHVNYILILVMTCLYITLCTLLEWTIFLMIFTTKPTEFRLRNKNRFKCRTIHNLFSFEFWQKGSHFKMFGTKPFRNSIVCFNWSRN